MKSQTTSLKFYEGKGFKVYRRCLNPRSVDQVLFCPFWGFGPVFMYSWGSLENHEP